MKDNRGQISIMMIITVIALIIFGGICIFMLTGENGLFIPKSQEQNVEQENDNIVNQDNEETNNTVDTNEVQDGEEQNTTNNENGALTVPMQ